MFGPMAITSIKADDTMSGLEIRFKILIVRRHYDILIHTYYYILCFYIKIYAKFYQLLCTWYPIGFYASQSVFFATSYSNSSYLSLVSVRETYISIMYKYHWHVYFF